jgi:hypothetical protein
VLGILVSQFRNKRRRAAYFDPGGVPFRDNSSGIRCGPSCVSSSQDGARGDVMMIEAFEIGLALQLPFMQFSESMGNHDSKIVDAASVD